MTHPDTASSLSRRAVLAGAAASAAASAGCVGPLQNVADDGEQSQLTLEIKALPVDSDPYGIRIAQRLRSNLEAAGINVRLRLVSIGQFTEQVLLNHDFDIYVGQAPFRLPPDPDALYPLFESTYTADIGWQNPFGFTNLTCDDLLAAQRSQAGDDRQQTVTTLQETLARNQPMSPLVVPERLTGVRTDRFTGWDPDDRAAARGGPTRPHNLLLLERADDAPAEDRTLRLATANDRLTSNRNPISAAYRQEGTLLDLVYDSIALQHGSEYVPWLARELTWLDGDGPPEVEIELREDLLWHDGEQLSAYDVGFTYAFLQDTSLGAASRAIPTERFRGPVSLVEDITVENGHRLRLTFTDTTRPVARRALTVPILPAHIWRDRTRLTGGSNRASRTTLALTSANSGAIGSGPLRFETAGDSTVEFSVFDQHFLWPQVTSGGGSANETEPETDWWSSILDGQDGDSNEEPVTNGTATPSDQDVPTVTDGAQPPEPYGGVPPFDTVTVEAVSTTAVVGLVEAGNADATVGPVDTGVTTVAENSAEIELIESQPNAFYHLGFNTRREPLRNPNVRQFVAQLLDKQALVEESFDGYGTPAASPLAGTDWLAESLQWDAETDTDPIVPFLGTDGELSVEDAREQLRELGYQYNSDNELVS
ncbi:MAG: ABC transporter substrate-binding protein [Euryarchaeota archaeon]|nr:ABC transporter substrate-binding protein [Euryarchaeota archaeon]